MASADLSTAGLHVDKADLIAGACSAIEGGRDEPRVFSNCRRVYSGCRRMYSVVGGRDEPRVFSVVGGVTALMACTAVRVFSVVGGA